MNPQEVWQIVLTELQLSLSKPIFSSWFLNTKIIDIKKLSSKKQLVNIAVANPYAKDTIEQRYLGQVIQILEKITGLKNECIFTVSPFPTNKKREKEAKEGPLFTTDFVKIKEQEIKNAIIKTGLREDFTFENFAVSSSNEVGYAASQAVAKSPGKVYHLLFLYGGVGVGKTHLMQAIGHDILKQRPKTAIVYSTAEDFTNEIIHAIRTKTTVNFRQKYREAKLLLVDDVQFIAGKDTVQEEFFHTFNTIHRAGGQIILTSDKLPNEIAGLEDRLRSRFEGGLTVDIQKPNFELRTAILLIKAKQWNQFLPMDVAQVIAANIDSTRRLEGFLVRLITESQAKKIPITPDLVNNILGKVGGQKQIKPRSVKPNEVIEIVARHFNVKTNQLKGISRVRPVVVPRQIAMYLLRIELNYPLERVGEFFGGRDHTTVMHSVEKIGKDMVVSESLRLDIEALKKQLYG